MKTTDALDLLREYGCTITNAEYEALPLGLVKSNQAFLNCVYLQPGRLHKYFMDAVSSANRPQHTTLQVRLDALLCEVRAIFHGGPQPPLYRLTPAPLFTTLAQAGLDIVDQAATKEEEVEPNSPVDIARMMGFPEDEIQAAGLSSKDTSVNDRIINIAALYDFMNEHGSSVTMEAIHGLPYVYSLDTYAAKIARCIANGDTAKPHYGEYVYMFRYNHTATPSGTAKLATSTIMNELLTIMVAHADAGNRFLPANKLVPVPVHKFAELAGCAISVYSGEDDEDEDEYDN